MPEVCQIKIVFHILYNAHIYHIDAINGHNIHRSNIFHGCMWSYVS